MSIDPWLLIGLMVARIDGWVEYFDGWVDRRY